MKKYAMVFDAGTGAGLSLIHICIWTSKVKLFLVLFIKAVPLDYTSMKPVTHFIGADGSQYRKR